MEKEGGRATLRLKNDGQATVEEVVSHYQYPLFRAQLCDAKKLADIIISTALESSASMYS